MKKIKKTIHNIKKLVIKISTPCFVTKSKSGLYHRNVNVAQDEWIFEEK